MTDSDWLDLSSDELAAARERTNLITLKAIGDAFLAGLGGGESPVDPCENNYEFAKKYDLKLDGVPITGPTGIDGDYKHLRELYEDTHRKKVLMAAAQSGKSGFIFVDLGRNACGPAYGSLIGYYFPDIHLPKAYSRDRFRPFIKGNADLAKLVGAPRAAGTSADAILTMNIGETTLYFLTIGGKTATEGLPLKCVYFDEVRRMELGDVERAQERYSAQVDPIDVKVSTPNYPESTIHHYFLKGDQRFFHTACDCPSGIVLSLTFPACVADLRNATPAFLDKVHHAYAHAGLPLYGVSDENRGEFPPAVYHCPKCGKIIVDPRDGWWEAHAPNNWVHSYQMPQMLSPRSSAGQVLSKFEKNTDVQEFHNSTLGLPYVDVEKMPVRAEHIDACVNDALKWGEHLTDEERHRLLPNCALGLDVQAGYGILCIKARSANGKQRTVHLEVVRPSSEDEERSWWYRVGQLMARYDVRLAVVDEAPEYTASFNFAKAFRGRVFLANFALGPNAPRFVQWDDEGLAGDQKQKGETASRHRVSMHRVRALHWSLTRWRDRQREIPALGRLVQTLPLQEGKPVFSSHLRVGTEAPYPIGFVLRDHLTRFVFRDVLEDEPEKAARGEKKFVAEYIGGSSPDFAFADLYASIALDRIGVPSGVRNLR